MKWMTAIKIGGGLAYAYWRASQHAANIERMKNNPLRVFLSHASEDKPAVRKLCVLLNEQPGIYSWLDESNLNPGDSWDDVIQKSLAEAHVAVICLSRRAIEKLDQSSYFLKEVEALLDRAAATDGSQIPVIPVKLEPCEMPTSLKQWQSDMIYEIDGYQNLLRVLVGQSKYINGIGSERITPLYNQGDISRLAPPMDVQIRFLEPAHRGLVQMMFGNVNWIDCPIEVYLDDQLVGTGTLNTGIDFTVNTFVGKHFVRYKNARAFDNTFLSETSGYNTNKEFMILVAGKYIYRFGSSWAGMSGGSPGLERL